ncbi:MAG: gluconokinase [Sphaerospermopsis kisseleviana]
MIEMQLEYKDFMGSMPLLWIISGVSGSGKTVVGRLLSERLECDFLEGDRRHTLANIRKMASQTPLNDTDRKEWLLRIEEDIRRAKVCNNEAIITCSCLKASYRKQLTSLGQVQLVWISVPEEVLEQRLAGRDNHFMKLEMLNSQLATFEPIRNDENVIVVNGVLKPREIVDELMTQAIQRFPGLALSWWQRIEMFEQRQ